jgi:hypothetical protein
MQKMPSKSDNLNADKKKDNQLSLFMDIIDKIQHDFDSPESFLDVDRDKCDRFKSYLKKMCDYLNAEDDLSSGKVTINGANSAPLLPSELIVDKNLVDNEQIYQQLQLYNGDTLASLPSLSKFFAKCMLKLDSLKLNVDKGAHVDAKKRKRDIVAKLTSKEKTNEANIHSESLSSADDGDNDDDDDDDEDDDDDDGNGIEDGYGSEIDNQENLNEDNLDEEEDQFDDDFDEAELDDKSNGTDNDDDDKEDDDDNDNDNENDEEDDEYDYMFDDELPGEKGDENDPNVEYDLVGAENDSGLYTGQLDNIEEMNFKKEKIAQKQKSRVKNLFADENEPEDEANNSKQAKSSLELRQEKVF